MSFLALSLIKCYQLLISPVLPRSCRFYPSCSHYGTEAIQRHGFVKGLFFTLIRILKCNPFFKGGYDPVPEITHCTNNLNHK